VVTRSGSYPSFLSNTVTNPDRRAHCAAVRAVLAATDGDENGDYTPFWAERDYNPAADKVEASVFVVHGLQDDNVMPDHFSKWWDALPANVPKKLWLTRTGHIDPFEFRRAEWVSTIHRWFDHELQGVNNGILREPKADIEYAADTWQTFKRWPVDAHDGVPLTLVADTPTTAGSLAFGPTRAPSAPDVFQTITDTPSLSENNAISNPTVVAATPNRRVFLSAPLTEPIHISGTPFVRLRASANATDTNFGAVLVDYGPATQVSRTGDGIQTLGTFDCWGEASPNDDACYFQAAKRLTAVTQWRVSKGILDALNRNSYALPTPLVPDVEETFTFPLLPQDYVFPAGHRIGLVLVGSYSGYSSQADTNRAVISLNVTDSVFYLPVVGGRTALKRGGIERPAPPATLATPADEPESEPSAGDLTGG
jgi:X-Pro dipeptidyl-peptidase